MSPILFPSRLRLFRRASVVAQELYPIYPEAVIVGGDDPLEDPWTVDYGRLSPPIVKSIQDLKREQDAEIKALNAENVSLKQQLDRQKSMLLETTVRVQELEAAGITARPPQQ